MIKRQGGIGQFHKKGSTKCDGPEQSARLRYFSYLKLDQRTTHERLIRVCFNDYDREMAIVAEHQTLKNGNREILGVGRLSKVPGGNEAEFALLLSDPWQNRGLGSQLLRLLLQIARAEKLRRVTADILPENVGMQRICEKLGFHLERSITESLVRAQIDL